MVTRCCSYSCFVLLKMGDSDAREHVEQLSDKINSVTCASCWNYILEYYYDAARTHEHEMQMDPSEVGWGGMDWIDLAQDWDKWRAVVNAVMNLWAA